MGNRKGRSTETALRLLTDLVRTAWKHGGAATLLSLDISGAFDSVDHGRLLANLRALRVPIWTINWIRSFLSDRSTTLFFDDQESDEISVPAGVPQGSPLSPILFCLYTAGLYKALRAIPGIATIAFVDDTNLISFGLDLEQTCERLKAAHRVCKEWAINHSMTFAVKKYHLVYFSRK